jgi:hypothetical protein
MVTKPLTLAVDFDGVIANYDGWEGEGSFGEPRQDVIEALYRLKEEGWKIIVYSCRSADQIIPYLVSNSIPFDEVNENSNDKTAGPKISATVYWDDRACYYSGDASKDLDIIRNFRTWNGRR